MRRSSRTVTALVALLLTGGLALQHAAAEPSIVVRRDGETWTRVITMDSDPGGTTLYLRLASVDAGSEPQTYHFTGPAGDDEYCVLYSVSGEEVGNAFDVSLQDGESEIVQVDVLQLRAPRNYLFASFALADAEGETDVVTANLIVPGDLMVRKESALVWAGEAWFADTLAPWDVWEMPAAVTRSQITYTVKLATVLNARSVYDLRAYRQDAEALIARYYLDGQEITDVVASDTGYRTGLLEPGQEVVVTARFTPVGTQADLRQVAFAARLAEVPDPGLALDLPLRDLSPFAIHLMDVPAQEGDEFIVYDGDQFAPGNFGLIDFDGGSNPTPPLRDWILNGYDDLVVERDVAYTWAIGNPGWREALLDAMQQKIDAGAVMRGLVYDEVIGQGAGSEVRLVGIMEFAPLAADAGYIRARLESFVLLRDMLVSAFDAVNFGAGPPPGMKAGPWREIPRSWTLPH